MLIDLGELIKKYNLNIKGVIHVGAHELEELSIYKKYNINESNIIWFEANPYLANKNKHRNVIHAAISDINDEELTLHITNNGQSSSLLELDKHAEYYPHIINIEEIKVKTKRLDSLIHDFDKYNMINIDIQGCELMALKGLGDNIKKLEYLYLEVNEEHLYKDCPLVGDIDEYVKQFGFYRLETSMTDKGWGDAFYMKYDKLVSIVLMGGIGNQLFQLATLYSYAKENNLTPIIDTSKKIAIHGPYIYDELPKLKEYFSEGKFTNYIKYNENDRYYKDIPQYNCNLLIEGYFNNEKYFIKYKDDIKNLFNTIFGKIEYHHNNIIHVRRGDYLNTQFLFNVLGKEYYDNVYPYLNDTCKTICVGEDIEWCKNNIKSDEYVSNSPILDFNLIRGCMETIAIANSTFSWWAAYLSNAKKIIYPLDWFSKSDYLIYQRYHVNNWLGLTVKNNNDIINFITNSTNTNYYNDMDIYINNLLQYIDKFSYRQQIDIYNYLLIVNWNLKNYDICKRSAYNIINICNNKIVSIPKQIRQNIIYPLNNDAYINIDLKNIPIYMIARPERQLEMSKIFEPYNLTLQFIDAYKSNISPRDACSNAHIKALKLAVKNNKFPFLLLEDDVKIMPDFKTEYKVHKTIDALYLGLSVQGVDQGNGVYNIENHIVCSSDIDNYIKINNMLGAHAIIYINPKFVKKCIKYIKLANIFRLPNDIANARLQVRSNVICPSTHHMVQDIKYAPHNCKTYVDMSRYL